MANGEFGSPAFQTINKPDLLDVGHYIFLRCGHNGHLLDTERKVLMKHFLNGGIIQENDAVRFSLMSNTITTDRNALSTSTRGAAHSNLQEKVVQPFDNLESDAESVVAFHDI